MKTFTISFGLLLLGAISLSGCAATNLNNQLRAITILPPAEIPMRTPLRRKHSSSLSSQSRVIHGVEVDQYTSAPLQRLKTVRLAAPVETVFKFVADHERMPDWIPMMSQVTMNHKNSRSGAGSCDVGSIRTCRLGSDQISEQIVIWESPRMFAYRVIDGQKGVPIEGGFGLVTFKPHGPSNTEMTWRIYYEPKKWNPKATVLPLMVNYQLNGGLKNLTKRFGGDVVRQ